MIGFYSILRLCNHQYLIFALQFLLVVTLKTGGSKIVSSFIISDSKLRNILSPQLKKISAQYKAICGCDCCIYAKSMNSSLL